MVRRSHLRAIFTVPLVAIAVSLFNTSAAQAIDGMATVSGDIVANGPADAPPPERAALGLEVLAAEKRGRVTLRFTLPRAGIVRIVLTTDAGREVGTLASGLSSAGDNRLELDVRKIPAGTYHLTLQSRDGNASTRLVIAK